MKTYGLNSGNILLAAIATALLMAQVLVPAHSVDHDTGFAQGQLCAACIAAAQLSTGCIDQPRASNRIALHTQPIDMTIPSRTSCDPVCSRQRGPPATS